MNSKFFGAVFLILGTCIGGSMLALPMATASEGSLYTLLIMLGAWFIMTIGAYALLNVNLQLPEDSNLISMAKATLGKPGAILTWITCSALLYTLLSAYISSGADLLANLFGKINLVTPYWLNSALFATILGFIVFRGIKFVDIVNRGLMSSKLLVCSALILLLLPFSHLYNLSSHAIQSKNALMTCMAAFGYACIIPSIRTYLNSDRKKLLWAVFLGGIIPLICYLSWIFVVQAAVSNDALNGIGSNEHPLKGLIDILSVHNPVVTLLTDIFTSICVLTSFLGVSLSLSDFISDGIKIKKEKKGLYLIAALTLLPPLGIVLLFPSIFLNALNYAGILCIILLVIMPLLMSFSLILQRSRSKRVIA